MNAIEVTNISHAYPPSKNLPEGRKALFGLSLAIPAGGGLYSLLGPNGGGKTTLFRILSTSLKPTEGEAFVSGEDVVHAPAKARFKIGVVFQKPSLDKKLTVEENLIHQGKLFGLSQGDINHAIRKNLTIFGLMDRVDDLVENLSGGLQRRAEIAKSLLHEPEVLILDEPSTGLDPAARRDLLNHLLALKKKGTTVLLTTHLMEEADASDSVFILHQGRLRAQGTPAELKGRIGGEVLTLHTKKPVVLAEKIRSEFKENPTVVGNALRIEKQNAHRAMADMFDAFPDYIEEASISKPTLEDVFVHVTGVEFKGAPEEGAGK